MSKIVNTLRKYLTEIGDSSSQKYKWTKSFDDEVAVVYKFKSPVSGLVYDVMFASIDYTADSEVYTASFTADSEVDIVTNKNELYKVMATVFEIVQHFLDTHHEVKTLEISGYAKDGEDILEPTQRTKLYVAYLKNILKSGWNINVSGNNITVTRKNN